MRGWATEKNGALVKHAYIKWGRYLWGDCISAYPARLPGSRRKSLGISVHRKTVLDLNKIGSSADIGVSLKGKSGRLLLCDGWKWPWAKSEDDEGKGIRITRF